MKASYCILFLGKQTRLPALLWHGSRLLQIIVKGYDWLFCWVWRGSQLNMVTQVIDCLIVKQTNPQKYPYSSCGTSEWNIYGSLLFEQYNNFKAMSATPQLNSDRLDERQFSKLPPQQYKKQFNTLGKYRKIMSDYGEGEPLLTIGPNYLFFIISFLVVNFISIVIIVHLNNHRITQAFFYLTILVLVYLDVTWLASALINPGIAIEEPYQDGEMCRMCLEYGREILKTQDRFHCHVCEVCISDQVMHFRLIGGCVGKNNFIAFKLLLLGIFMWCFSLLTILPQFGSHYL